MNEEQHQPGRYQARGLRCIAAALVLLLAALPVFAAVPGHCGPDAGVSLVEHSLSVSYCELCGTGEIHIVIANPYGVDLTDLTVEENLGATGLTYVPGSTTFNGTWVPTPPVVAPTVAGSILTWNLGSFVLPGPTHPTSNHAQLEITFQVRRAAGLTEEDLVTVARDIEARLDYNYSCSASQQHAYDNAVLPIRQPLPQVIKLGRNVDAAQGGYTGPVYGHNLDDIIWRVEVRNGGLAALQDLIIHDLMASGNFDINYLCTDEPTAEDIANNDGTPPGATSCIHIGPTTGFDYIPPGLIDVPASGSTFFYLVGKVTNSCVDRRNSADIEWGCQVDVPAGGITAPADGVDVAPSNPLLGTAVVNNGLQIVRTYSGTNLAQPVGTKGTVTITITNNSGGTVRNIQLLEDLPDEYMADPTFTPTITVNPAYGAYGGMTNRIDWTNRDATVLNNNKPNFTLYSSTTNPDHADQRNLLRPGDQLVVRFRIVMVKEEYFDRIANLDVREEAPDSDPAGTDPDNDLPLVNRLKVKFEQFCNPGVVQALPPGDDTQMYQDTFTPNPEDLDIDIEGTALIFILTNTDPLPLRVNLANHGGHDAADWTAFVAFGATMAVTPPAGCVATSNPPPMPTWNVPAGIPAGASVFRCTGAVVAPGETRPFDFVVQKSTNVEADDLTFRADVTGRITLSSGALLTEPPPSDAIGSTANNYSLDAIRARVIGFNLLKSTVGNCTEENPPSITPDRRVQIGEECTYHIDTGGWFGFKTPGFTYIAVQRVEVTDALPNGQGFLNSTDPYADSSSTIKGVSRIPAGLQPLDEGAVQWTFNQDATAERITERDQWFHVDLSTRILNDALNARAAPNYHTSSSLNILTSTFQAIFENPATGMEDPPYTLGPTTVGYPEQTVRQVEMRVIEPRLTVTKRVCNETLYGAGIGCSNFVALADNGDAYNSYIYRIRVTNEATSGGYTRAPAYDIVSTDTLDASDLMHVIPFETDGLDNDGDGLIDADDTDGEGSISENVVNNGTPAVITFSHTHSAPLLRIAPGATVTFYYRVDPDDTVAPVQSLINSVQMDYDSLAGDWGHQTAPQRATGDVGGARRYQTTPTTATVQIIPVLTQPKKVVATSYTPLAPSPQPVTLGEEVAYELVTRLPVAMLRNFVIRDELPAGLRCVDAPVVDLDAAPYSAAGFVPGGQITPTCAAGYVQWNFGNQRITHGTVDNRYDFAIRFIARVDNSAGNNDGTILGNGGAATTATASYVNQSGATVTLSYELAQIQVREPRIALTKSFQVVNSDAGDEVAITITATNTGTSPAYNLQVLDDLAAVGNLIFLSGVGGLDPPNVVDTTTFGANRPLFQWTATNPRFAIAPGATVSFTFHVRVEGGAQPLEIFNNTAHATWTSLPSRLTPLSSSGQIGPNGSLTGMRNGAVPPAGNAINDYESSASAAMSVPAITLSKSDLAPATVPAPGAHKHFRIEIRLPEGTSTNVTATDNLAAGGVSYVLANNAGFDVTYSFSGIATINGAAPSEAAFVAFPADGTSGTATWNIGTVVTATENDLATHAVTPTIRIDYYARVNNDLVTDAGDTVQNGVTLNYRNGETGATETLNAATPVVTVVEPQLTAVKAWANVTAGKAATDLPDGGDLLQYTITLHNGGTSTAHDINIVDRLSADLRLDSGFTATATVGGVAVTGFVATPAGAPAGPLVWGRGNGDATLDLPAGQDLVLTYRVRVAATVEPGTVLTNSVLADWTSLDGASTWERTGAGCPTITAPNDYCTGPATTTVTVADNNSIAKAITADTWADAPFSTASDAIVRVGDTLTYRLAIHIQEGRTRQVRVQDALPTGMTFVDIISVNGDTTANYTPPASGAGSNFSYVALTAANRPAAGQTGTLIWNFGTITNDPAGDATTDDLVIIYRARVTPDAGIPHVPETTLTNVATLAYVDVAGNPSPPAARLTDDAVATLRQPVIDLLTKTDRSGRISGNTVNIATDVMNFRLSACNNSGRAPAYSLLLTDTLATQLNEASLAGPVRGAGRPDVYINGVLATAGTDYVYTAAAGRGGSFTVQLNKAVNPGQCALVDYNIGFHSDVGANQSWQNSVTVNEYWSLANRSGQRYGPVGPAIFAMNNIAAPLPPPAKSLSSPASGEATVGNEVIYRIAVPATAATSAMYDVTVTDTLDASLRYLSARDVSGNGFALTDNTVLPGNVSLRIAQIPAGRQAIIELHARVANNADANAGRSFSNSTAYTYANEPGGAPINGGTGTTPTALLIVEPGLTLAKTVQNLTRPGLPPDAGDVLRYTLTVTAAGGAVADNYSDAFDLGIVESLGLGLAWHGNGAVTGAGNTLGAPVISGNGTTTAQTLRWGPAQGNADVDVVEGSTITVTYEAVVLDPVRANQTLTNATALQWTGLDGASTNERNGTGAPAWNDYFTAASVDITTGDTLTVTKSRVSDTWGEADTDLRIGDLVRYELRIAADEGTHSAVVVTDTLPQGLRFERTLSINGDTSAPFGDVAPFTHADIAAPTVTGDARVGPTSVVWNVGDLVNAGDNAAGNNAFVIVYLARVVDRSLAHVNDTTLTNTVTVAHTTATGTETATGNMSVVVRQPTLVVAKSAIPAGGDTVIEAGELITYTVLLTNTGTGPAYDPLLRDVLPVGLRQGAAGITTLSTRLMVAGTDLPNVTPAYNAATGIVEWNFDTGVANRYTIAPGETLRVVYRVQADAGLSPGLTLTNSAVAQRYYSFDDEDVPSRNGISGVREIYGPSNTATVTLTTAAPNPLLKQNPAVTTASVGVPFTYRITVPATPQATALHDVRIVDDLTTSAADLSFVSVARVSGSRPWTPVNTGTATQVVIEDTTNGIEIPAGEQIVIDLTVVLDDSPTNVSGLLFRNTASYTFNAVNGDSGTRAAGGAGTTGDMTIVGADDFTVEKGGPATLRAGVPGNFTLNAHNTGTGRAWDLTLTDLLPNPAPGGMCSTAPNNITARVYESDGTTPVSAVLAQGADYTVSFSGEPDCRLTVTMRSPAASVGAGQRLIVTYDAYLDGDNVNGTTLTNVAGATRWFSADTTGSGATGATRTYTRTLTDGTVGTLDHEDAHTLTTETAVVEFRKSVINRTTGQDPGANATPGDTLRYRVQLRNLSTIAVTDFTLRDEVDALNGSAMFVPGTLVLVTVPAGGDTTLTSATGGARGTGLVSIAHLNLAASGAAGDTLVAEFDVRLAPAITNGTVVLNQAQIRSGAIHTQNSDDPNVGGADDPAVLGDEDPTRTVIASTPRFRVQKTSRDMTGDPAVLMPGDVLRYTITIKNVGTENTTGVTLRDGVPANTTYVANSTRLNGALVADPAAGVSPLQAGMLVHAPEDATAGAMRADGSTTTTNVATVTFDVRIDAGVVNGTVISNQGFVTGAGASGGAFPERPSDDPRTTTPDDPTRDVVGNVPLVDAQKTVAISTDGGTAGVVDASDVIRYTITVTNSGGVQATNVVLTDAVPANTTYVANSTFLNGVAAGQPDGGVSPLAGGLAINSAGAAAGVLAAHSTATITFDVRVNVGVAAGTVIRNQGTITSQEQSPEPTDADGIDSNGDQPTDIIVGSPQQLAITKEVAVVGGGPVLAGSQLEYTVRVTNTGLQPATAVVITDDLGPLAALVTYVPGSGTMNGSATGVTFAGGLLTGDYSTNYGALAVGASVTVRFRVDVNGALAIGTTITNTAQVGWSAAPRLYASATVSVDVGGTPGTAALNGRVWHDANFSRSPDSGELSLANWSVDVYRSETRIGTATTDTSGIYRITGLAPDTYNVRFRAPGAGANTGSLGWGDSAFTNRPQRINGINAISGSNLLNLNLPLQPDGVIYNSVVRTPVAGATVTLVRPGTGVPLPAGCFDDPAQQGQVTTRYGYYKFDLNFADPACAAPGDYLIRVTPPATGYLAGESRFIPPSSNAATPSFSVPGCAGGPDDAIPAPANYCEIQGSEFAPGAGVAVGRGTNYYLHLHLSNGLVPQESQAFNNHIPLDPQLTGAVAITKTAGRVNVSRGEMVPYTITIRNNLAVSLRNTYISDRYPAGFKYVEGSARLDGAKVEPVARANRELVWTAPVLDPNVQHEVRLLLVVGSGVSEGEYVNRAQLFNTTTGQPSSAEAQATVRVVPDPTFDCTDLIGKVFDDKNRNGIQDDGEPGLPGVRIVSARGLIMTTDQYGRYHITCAAVPNEERGSNFILKLDERSLPTGYRLTTENPLVQRATRGKMVKFNFGAAIHRVVTLGLQDGVFEPGSTEIRTQWQPRLATVISELRKDPSVLRLSYMADVEDPALVDRRIAAVRDELARRWREVECCSELPIETELFWRRGAPPEKGSAP